MEGRPFVVAGEGEFEARPDGVVGGDGDLVDEGLEHGLAGVGGAVCEDVSDAFADLAEVAGGEGLGWLVEFVFQLGLAGA